MTDQASHRIGIYAGSFDPPTLGHLDIIRRARLHLVDALIIAIAVNDEKSPCFSFAERMELFEYELNQSDWLDKIGPGRIEIVQLSGVLVEFARTRRANFLIRGLRAVSDFDYEFQMTGMNARMARDLETVFLMASESVQFISSRMVKEIARLGGDISPFVGARTACALKAKFG